MNRSLYFAFVVTFVVLGCGGYLIYSKLKQSMDIAFTQRAESIVHSLAGMGEHYLSTSDWPMLDELVQRAMDDPIVITVRIDDFLTGRSFGRTKKALRETEKHYAQSIYQDGKAIGRVSVVIDERALKVTLDWLRGFLWFAMTLIFLVVSGLADLLLRVRLQADTIKREASERRRAEQNLRKLSMAVEQSPASVVITDSNAVIEYVNPKFLEVTGYLVEEVLGQNPRLLNSGLTPKETFRRLWNTLGEGKEWRGEFHNRKKNGDTYWEHASISPIRAADGSISHYLAVKEDITLHKDYEARLVRQANYDSLTGLANRILARDRLEQAIKRAYRDGGIVSLLFIDLDHFKKVNDTLGHAAGDDLLKETARRLKRCVRGPDTISRSDDFDDLTTVARLGGDEFTVILHDLRKPLDAEVVSERILNVCAEPFLIKGQELFLSASIGITIYPDDAREPEILMRNADAAMYRAKESGRGSFHFFRPEINDIAQERLMMENEIRNGFANDELEVHFQPLFNCYNNNLEGAEALLRWRSPSRGLVQPNRFIPLVEDTGLIVPIGEWVLRTACEQAVIWQKYRKEPLYVSVNISSRQFQNSNLVDTVSRILNETMLLPHCLKLEITETVLLQETEKTRSAIQEIHDMGVGFSIDDFGTGYSSLSYLRLYPFETLKIDRSFVRNVLASESDAHLVESIISMALNLKLKVVAEGIETEEQYAFVRNAGCDSVQGYGLGHPVPAREFLSLVSAQKAIVVRALV